MVVIAAPFHCTVEPAVKPVPLTVSVKAAPVAAVAAGARLVITGGCAVTVSESVFVTRTPALTTIETLPAPVITLAGTDAVS